MLASVEVYQVDNPFEYRDGETWRWELLDENGITVATSSDHYSEEDAEAEADEMRAMIELRAAIIEAT